MEKKENIVFLILVILAAMGMAFVFGCKVIPTQTPDTEPIGPYHHRDPATWAKKNAIKNQPKYYYYDPTELDGWIIADTIPPVISDSIVFENGNKIVAYDGLCLDYDASTRTITIKFKNHEE